MEEAIRGRSEDNFDSYDLPREIFEKNLDAGGSKRLIDVLAFNCLNMSEFLAMKPDFTFAMI